MASLPKVGVAAWLVLLPGLILIGTALLESPAPGAAGGAAIYAQRCASCHMALAETSVSGASADAIRSAITKVKQMKSLSDMSATDVQAVAGALAAKPAAATSQPASAPSGAADGAALYQSHCASCHQPLAQSRMRNVSSREIQRAIDRKRQMKSLSGMTPAQVQAVADALAGKVGGSATSAPAAGGRRRERGNDD
jgi:mono/diheme cytochrome c family protein